MEDFKYNCLSQHSTATQKITKLELELGALKNVFEKTQTELAEQKKATAAMEAKFHNGPQGFVTSAELQNLRNQLEVLIKASNRSTDQDVSTLDKRYNRLRERTMKLEEEAATKAKELGDGKSEVSLLKAKVEELEREVQKMKPAQEWFAKQGEFFGGMRAKKT